MIKGLSLWMLILSMLAFGACATVDSGDKGSSGSKAVSGSDGTGEVLELKAKIDELNNRVFVMTEQIESLRARLRDEKLPTKTVAQIQTQKQEQPPAVLPTPKPTPAPVPTPSVQIPPSSPGQGLSAEQRIVQQFLETEGVSASSTTTSQALPPAAPSVVNSVMYNNYISAYAFFNDKQYARSLIAFSSFIDQYPDTILTPNAYFWLAESYYHKKEYILSIQEYLKLLEKFPTSSKVPQAVSKLSEAYSLIGDSNTSEKYRRLLLEKYPKSRAARGG